MTAAQLPAGTYRDLLRASARSPAEGAAVEALRATISTPAPPDRLCVLCRGSGKARVRAPGPVQRGLRAVVIWARPVASTLGASIDASADVRAGDRLVTCPSCSERDELVSAALEGSVFAVEPTSRRP